MGIIVVFTNDNITSCDFCSWRFFWWLVLSGHLFIFFSHCKTIFRLHLNVIITEPPKAIFTGNKAICSDVNLWMTLIAQELSILIMHLSYLPVSKYTFSWIWPLIKVLSKWKDWMAWNCDNVTEWSRMDTCELSLQLTSTKNLNMHVGFVQSRCHHRLIDYKLFSP